MGKNKIKGINSEPVKQKTQEQEPGDAKRVPLGFYKNNPTKSK